MKLRNKIVALFLTVACAFGLAVAGNAQRVDAAEEKISISFANKAQRTEYTTSKQVWVQNGVTVTNDKGASTSNVGDYFNPARFYKSSKLTISTELNITKIVFDTNSGSYATALKNSIGNTASVSSDKVTVNLDGSINSYVIAKFTEQVRMDAITVTVTDGAAEEELTPEEQLAEAVENLSVGTDKTIASLSLPTIGENNTVVTWASDDESILTNTGVLVARPTVDTIVTLTATITLGELTATKEFDVTVKGIRATVTNPVAGKYYKMVLSQENIVKDLYLTGKMKGFYYETTEDISKAALVSLVEVEGGYYLISKVNGKSSFMNIEIEVKNGKTYNNVVFGTTPSTVWVFNTQYNTFTTKLSDGKTYFLGTSGTYNTFSANNSTNLGKTGYYPSHLVELTEEETVKAMGVKVGFQVGTKDEAKALRLVAAFDFAAEEVANFDKEISFKVTHNDVADERVVTTLYSSVNPMNDEEVLEDGYYAVLTYVNVPAGEYLVEVLVDGVVAATVTATVA